MEALSPDQLLEMANKTKLRWPNSALHKNQVGNLAIEVDGEYVGWLNLRTGEIHDFEPETTTTETIGRQSAEIYALAGADDENDYFQDRR